MKLRKHRASELDPRSVVVLINDVNKLINNICKSDMSDKDKVEMIKEYLSGIE